MTIKETFARGNSKAVLTQEYKQLEDQQLSYALLHTYEQIVLPLAFAATQNNITQSPYHNSTGRFKKGEQSYEIMDQFETEIEAMLLAASIRAEGKGIKIPQRTKATGLTCELDETGRIQDWEARLMQYGSVFADTAEKADWARHADWRNNKTHVTGVLHERPYSDRSSYYPVYDNEREAMDIPQKAGEKMIDRVKKVVPTKKEMQARMARLNELIVH